MKSGAERELAIRWLVSTSICLDGRIVRRRPGDEDIVPAALARKRAASGRCAILWEVIA